MPEGLYVPIRFGIVYVVGGTGFDCAELLLAVAEVVLKSVVKHIQKMLLSCYHTVLCHKDL